MLSSRCSILTAPRLPLRCVAENTQAIPPTPSSASRRHLLRSTVPTLACARAVQRSCALGPPCSTMEKVSGSLARDRHLPVGHGIEGRSEDAHLVRLRRLPEGE